MGLRKDGVAVGCELCAFRHGDDQGGFEIDVPIEDETGALSGNARIHCRIAPDAHQLTLLAVVGTGRDPVAAPESLRRVQGVLDHLAVHQVCGNARICPSEVVEVVRRFGDTDADAT